MREKNLMLACAAAFACMLGISMIGASAKPETAVIKGLMEQRTDIMENVLTGKISYKEGKEKLGMIEGEKLYKDDLEGLLKYRNSDIDRIESMKVINMEKTSHIYDMMTFDSEICWTYTGINGRYVQVANYLIGVKHNEDDYKLISLEFQH